MKLTKSMVEQYIESKSNAWAESTKKSEGSRLLSVLPSLNGKPETLWEAIGHLGRYTRVTTWTRVVDFVDFLVEQGKLGRNEYRQWRKSNAKSFKHAYERTKPTLSFEEALKKIASLKDDESREKALELLTGGMRYTESLSLEDGRVVGKGGKPRDVYPITVSSFTKSYRTFVRHLSEVGLRPHDLRKLFATKAVKEGANEHVLCELMGWNDIKTAASYIAVCSEEKRNLVNKIHGGINGIHARRTKAK